MFIVIFIAVIAYLIFRGAFGLALLLGLGASAWVFYLEPWFIKETKKNEDKIRALEQDARQQEILEEQRKKKEELENLKTLAKNGDVNAQKILNDKIKDIEGKIEYLESIGADYHNNPEWRKKHQDWERMKSDALEAHAVYFRALPNQVVARMSQEEITRQREEFVRNEFNRLGRSDLTVFGVGYGCDMEEHNKRLVSLRAELYRTRYDVDSSPARETNQMLSSMEIDQLLSSIQLDQHPSTNDTLNLMQLFFGERMSDPKKYLDTVLQCAISPENELAILEALIDELEDAQFKAIGGLMQGGDVAVVKGYGYRQADGSIGYFEKATPRFYPANTVDNIMLIVDMLTKVPEVKDKAAHLENSKLINCVNRHLMFVRFFKTSDENAKKNNRSKQEQAEWFSRLSIDDRAKILTPYFGNPTKDEIWM